MVAKVSELSRVYAPVILALYVYAYVLRGGALLFGFINLTLVFLLLAVACAVFPLVFDRGSVRYRFSWADAAIVAFGLVMLVNSSTAEGLEKALRFHALALTAYFVARLVLVDANQVRKFLYTIVAAASTLAVLALAATLAPGAVEGTFLGDAFHGDRLTFAETNPIPLAWFLMVGALIFIGFMPGLGTRAKILAGAMFTMVVFMLFLTGSRGAVIGTLMALTTLLGLGLIKRSARHLRPIIFAFTIVSAMLYLLYFSGDNPNSPFHAIGPRFHDLSSLGDDPSIAGRLELYTEAIGKFLDNPLRGAGTAGMDVYAHNMFLETASELGLLGLAPLLVFLYLVSLNLFRFALRAKIRPPNLDVVAAAVLCFVSLFTVSQFSGNLANAKDLPAMFAIIINFPLLFDLTGRQGVSPRNDRIGSRPLKVLHVTASMSPEWGGPVKAVRARESCRCVFSTCGDE